jgi:hypothetical protein
MARTAAGHAMHRALGFEETERVIYFRKRISLEKQEIL